MDTNIEIKQALAELNKIAVERVDALEKEIKPDIDKLKSDVDTTVKAFDKFQINHKYSTPQQKQAPDLKSDVERALNENHQNLANYIKGEKSVPFKIEVKEMSISSSLSGGTAAVTMTPTQIVGAISRAFHIRDVLSQQPMTTGTLPIIKDNGVSGDYETVSEGNLKPPIDFFLVEQPAKAEVIAATVTVTRQFLDDLGPRGVMSWLQNRLTEMYLNYEDYQLLNGDGNSPNLTGLNDPGNYTAATSTTGSAIEQLVMALIQMRTLQRNPRVIIINPASLSDLILNQASGSGEFDFPPGINVNATGGLTVLGVPVVDTVGQTADVFDVLDTSGMIMGIREGFNIKFFEDAALAKYNKILIRGEARIAVANYSPYNVIRGTFGSES